MNRFVLVAEVVFWLALIYLFVVGIGVPMFRRRNRAVLEVEIEETNASIEDEVLRSRLRNRKAVDEAIRKTEQKGDL